MNPKHCEREPEIVEALHANVWHEDLSLHVESCQACAETRILTQALLQDAARMAHRTSPDASQVWRRAREQAREAALKRASRLFDLLRAAGFVYGLVLAAWCGHGLWMRGDQHFLPAGNGVVAGTVVLGALVALACMLLGLWYMACDDRAPLLRSAGR